MDHQKKQITVLERTAELIPELRNMIWDQINAPRTIIILPRWEQRGHFHHIFPYELAPPTGIEDGTYEVVQGIIPILQRGLSVHPNMRQPSASLIRKLPKDNFFHINWERDTLALNPTFCRERDPEVPLGDILDRENFLNGIIFQMLRFPRLHPQFKKVRSLAIGNLSWPVENAGGHFRTLFRGCLGLLLNFANLKELILVSSGAPGAVETLYSDLYDLVLVRMRENILVTKGEEGIALCRNEIEQMLQELGQGLGQGPQKLANFHAPTVLVIQPDDPRAPRFYDMVFDRKS